MNGMTLASSSRLAVAARATSYGDKRSSKKGKSGGSEGLSDTEWMQKARKLANQRAAKFRTERGAPPVAPNTWRRKRKTDANDPYADGHFEAARGYDDLPPRSKGGEDEDEEEQEMTATKGDGLWRVDMAALSEEDWATQWTMTLEEFKALEKEVKANANDPQTALQAFEEAGLRRVSPDIAAGMLKMIADVAKKARTDREELAGLRRDSRVAHLLGTCVAAARRNSDALTPNKLSAAAWSLAIISGERANSAEMEVLAERAALVVSEMKPRACADLAWALASCRHASPAFFNGLDVRFATEGLKKFKVFDVSTLVWAFAHLGHGSDGLRDGLEDWFVGASSESVSDADAAAAASALAKKFTPQALVTTAWSLSVVGAEAMRSRAFKALWGEIGRLGGEVNDADAVAKEALLAESGDKIVFGPWRGKHLNQINQCVVSVDACGGCDALGLAPLAEPLRVAASNAWMAQRRPPVVSWYQRDVASILSYMGEKHEEEAVCAGYRVDLHIPKPIGIDDATHKAAARAGVAVEVDGPSHFARNDATTSLGQTRLKHRQLRSLGFAVVSVPVSEWEYLETSEEKVEYLRRGIAHAAAVCAGEGAQ